MRRHTIKTTILNIDVSPNTDGFSFEGGTTRRILNVSGSNITLLGSGSITATFPTSSATIAGKDVVNTFTANQYFPNHPPVLSRGGTIINADGISTNDAYAIWRAPFPCSASAMYALRVGGSSTSVNLYKNTAATLLSASYLAVSGTSDFQKFNSVSPLSASFAIGDELWLAISGSGASPTQIAIQCDFVMG